VNLTDLAVITREKRIGEEESLRSVPSYEAPSPHCLKCGWAVEASKHYGHVFYFDHGTDAIHVCRESYGLTMARIRRAAENE